MNAGAWLLFSFVFSPGLKVLILGVDLPTSINPTQTVSLPEVHLLGDCSQIDGHY